MGRRDPERDVIVIERSGSSFWWLLAGGAVGAGLALLWAPQSGEQTRRQLGRRLSRLKDSAEDAFDEFKAAIDPVTAEDPDEAEAALPEGAGEKSPLAGSRRGGSPARRELERRLAAARARRHRALVDEDEDEDEEPVA